MRSDASRADDCLYEREGTKHRWRKTAREPGACRSEGTRGATADLAYRPGDVGSRARLLTLAHRHFFEATQDFELVGKFRHAVHWIEHHHIGAQFAPAVGCSRPALRIRLVHPQPAFDPEFARIPAGLLDLRAQQGELLLGLFVGRHDWHPAVTEFCRPHHHGIGDAAEPDWDRTLYWRRHDVDLFQRVEPPLECDEILRP